MSKTSLLGRLMTSSLESFDTDCQATIYVKTSTLRRLFRFQTDANSAGDLFSEDTKYFVDQQFLSRVLSDSSANSYSETYNKILNPMNAYLTNITGLNDNSFFDGSGQNLVRSDFIRYLAYSLTGTVYGTDLFDNENELLTHLGESGHDIYYENFLPAFQNAGTRSTPLTNSNTTNTNLSRSLL